MDSPSHSKSLKSVAGISVDVPRNPLQQRQIHFWLNDADYQFVQNLARNEGKSMSRILRRLIQFYRTNSNGQTGSTHSDHRRSS